ncbi:serine hydrolase [Lacinutrix sp. Bg11-31]|uniref:serine hydrolase n=1 Tax=Lacinutrix sp. Bg11-31 TaxID=2057808 RepID=UPI000C314032|nr:serine hydrolase [Lacinutrix sp. Bg11-31]AUC80913.1 hypothetical protein CW733_01705 [Lacinutrix sp. Bg11-31]
MKTLKTTIIVCFFAIMANAQITTKDIDNIVEEEMILQNLPGLAIGVFREGVINYTKGYGFKDVDSKIPISDTTVFNWASISKTLTAVAAFQIFESRNDIDINDAVIAHYPYWTANIDGEEVSDKENKEKITLKQLLTHRSGINHYRKGASYNKENYLTNSNSFNANSSVDVFRNMTLDFEPGDRYKYSSYGYSLLGAVIDEKTGSYTRWINTNIKNVLDMPSLEVSNDSMVGFQKPIDGAIKLKVDGSKEYVLPGGGWKSNIRDLLRFSRGIIEGELLENTDSLWRDDGNRKADGSPVKTRRGVLSEGSGLRHRIYHGGAHSNLRSFMYIKPNDSIAIVVLIPANYAKRENLVYKILNKMNNVQPGYRTQKTPINKCGTGMKSSNKNFVGVWRKTGEDVIIRRGYATNNFNTEWQFLSSKGYYLENFEFSNNLWNGVFKKGAGKYAMWRNYNQDQFNKKWKEMNKKGYRLYDLETYTINGKRKWAGLFKKGSGKYVMYRNYSTSKFGTKREKLAKSGYKLIDIEVYNSNNGLKWSGVWIAGEDGKLNRNFDEAAFITLVNKRDREGYNLIDVETYKVNGNRKWTGIWEKSNKAQRILFGSNYCDFMGIHDVNKDEFELIDINSY